MAKLRVVFGVWGKLSSASTPSLFYGSGRPFYIIIFRLTTQPGPFGTLVLVPGQTFGVVSLLELILNLVES